VTVEAAVMQNGLHYKNVSVFSLLIDYTLGCFRNISWGEKATGASG